MARPMISSWVFFPLAGPLAGPLPPFLSKAPSVQAAFQILARTFVFSGHSAEIGLFCILNSNFFFIGIGIPLGSLLPGPLYGSKADVVTLCQAFLRIAQFYSLPVQLPNLQTNLLALFATQFPWPAAGRGRQTFRGIL